AKDAIYKEDLQQVNVPLRPGVDPAAQLVALLRELVPPADTTAQSGAAPGAPVSGGNGPGR
ncbi:MAG: hypothetical protein RL219_264, partial [Actinomycetota bacterium]